MPGATFAEGDTVTLRTVEEADLDFFQEARNDPRVRRPLTLNRADNGEQMRQFYENAICGDDSVSLLVCVDERSESTSSVDDHRESTEDGSGETASSVDDQRESTEDGSGEATEDASDDVDDGSDGPTPVGSVVLFDEDDVSGTATLAYWLAPEYWGHGYATDAVGALLDHGFGDRRLHKVRAEVIESNDGSRRVLERLGFEREGTLRGEKFVDGEHVDVFRYGLLADEWGGR